VRHAFDARSPCRHRQQRPRRLNALRGENAPWSVGFPAFSFRPFQFVSVRRSPCLLCSRYFAASRCRLLDGTSSLHRRRQRSMRVHRLQCVQPLSLWQRLNLVPRWRTSGGSIARSARADMIEGALESLALSSRGAA
jgi:hypothetical protein